MNLESFCHSLLEFWDYGYFFLNAMLSLLCSYEKVFKIPDTKLLIANFFQEFWNTISIWIRNSYIWLIISNSITKIYIFSKYVDKLITEWILTNWCLHVVGKFTESINIYNIKILVKLCWFKNILWKQNKNKNIL